jgi:gamma-glutamylcysteine synthetase
MAVQKSFSDAEEIVLVDDVVTRGATLLGAANRLTEAFPNVRIRAFAAMRTMTPPLVFRAINDPCIGTIELRGIDTFRRP